MSDEDGTVTIADNPGEHRYEAHIGNELAGFAVYESVPGGVILIHTEVDPEFEGHGIASRLAEATLNDLRARGLSIAPRCPFFARYIRHHPEYQDMVAKERRQMGREP
jgi:predicted GNAT family acetyltransferase